MVNDMTTMNDVFGGADLAEAMGFGDMANSGGSNESSLPVLSQLYKAQKGVMDVRGKSMTVETVAGGAYKLRLADGTEVFSEKPTIRIFMQRFYYQRYEKFAVPTEDREGRMFRTTMALSLSKGDLKDNYGTFNCGRPGGYIKDYDSLGGPLRDIVKQTKRVMAVFGTVVMTDATDANGNPIDGFSEPQPFVLHVKNRYSYKAMETVVKAILKGNMLPVQRNVVMSGDSEPLPNGELNHFIVATPDSTVDVSQEDQQLMRDFIAYVEHHNKVISDMWAKATAATMDGPERDLIDQFVNVDTSADEDAA